MSNIGNRKRKSVLECVYGKKMLLEHKYKERNVAVVTKYNNPMEVDEEKSPDNVPSRRFLTNCQQLDSKVREMNWEKSLQNEKTSQNMPINSSPSNGTVSEKFKEFLRNICKKKFYY
uniref:Uncharacterized protein n=1 Tax=Parastrongyloides trichosuri TaxID=131310 RepID=A0A0N4Z5D3_PARTI